MNIQTTHYTIQTENTQTVPVSNLENQFLPPLSMLQTLLKSSENYCGCGDCEGENQDEENINSEETKA